MKVKNKTEIIKGKIKSFFTKSATVMLAFSLGFSSVVSSTASVVYAEDSTSASSSSSGTESGATTTGTVASDGTANGRVQAFISMAQGKQADPSALKNLTQDQLQFLGVYMSNFYVPWVTDLGRDDEQAQKTQDSIKNVLVSGFKFDETIATTFSENLMALNRDVAASALKVGFVKDHNTDIQNGGLQTPNWGISKKDVTWYDLLFVLSGLLYEHKDWASNKDSFRAYVNPDEYGSDKYRYAVFYYKDKKDGKTKEVLRLDTRGQNVTSSAYAIISALRMVDPSKGYGGYLLDIPEGALENNSIEALDAMLEKDFGGDLDKLAERALSAAPIGVSGFGDLFIQGQSRQLVILPVAMNPFTWQTLEYNGKKKGKYGNSLILNSLQYLSLLKSDKLGSFSLDKVREGSPTSNPSNFLKLNVSNVTHFTDMPPKKTFWTSDRGETRGLAFQPVVTYGTNFKDFKDGWFGVGTNNFEKLNEVITSNFMKSNGYTKDLGWNNSEEGAYMSYPMINLPSDSINIVTGTTVFDTNKAYGSSSDTGDSSEDSYGKDADGGVVETLQFFDIVDGSGNVVGQEDVAPTVSFGDNYDSTKTNSMLEVDLATAQSTMDNIYASYAIAGLLSEGNAIAGKLGYVMARNNLPSVPTKAIKLSASAQNDTITKAIRDWLYYLLHPTEGIAYFVELVTNKMNGLLLDWHNDMVGTRGVGVLPGTTRYLGFSGYVTTPELTDLEWTNSMIQWYNSIIIYLIIAIFVVMASYFILGMLTFQKAVLGLVIFSVFSFAPVTITQVSVNLSNRFANFVFGDKFAYWGIVAQQSYFAELADSIDSSNSTYRNYLVELYNKNASESRNQGGDNIVLRWQAPKKMANLVLTNKEEAELGSEATKLINVVLGAQNNSETFSQTTAANYFYRSYTDIANVSMFMYGDMVSNGQLRDMSASVGSSNTSNWSSGLKGSWTNYTSNYQNDRNQGYVLPDSGGSTDGSKAYRIKLPLSGTVYSDATNPSLQGTIKDLQLGEYVGLDQRMFNFSLGDLNSNANLITEMSSTEFDASNGGKYSNDDIKSLAAYGIMSENPFYYFSWGLYDQGLASNPTGTGSFKDLLLSRSDSGFFYNTDNNNEMRDYLDFRSMFTYLIPYLKQGNDLVREWDDTYGIFFYDGVTYEEGHEGDSDIANNPELAQKYWHNVNVARLYNIYTPWVDLMYDSSYAKSEKISYQGETYTVSDPINPATYPTERPMVFSRSEMYDYGLREDQLTKVERKLMAISDKVMAKWYNLLNYYNFADVVLNTSAAMEASFIFNQEFSEANLVGGGINIYPQSLELKNFTYDAFLRMILANSTGESLVIDEEVDGSLYERIVKNSSFTTGIFLIILDILAVYVIPPLKLFIVILLFISAVLVLLISAISVNEDIGKKTLVGVAKAVGVPALGYLGVSVAMSWVVSLFMGNGNTAVTGYDGKSIVLGDPAMTLFVLLVLNAIVLYAYWKVLRQVWAVLRKYGGTVMSHLGGVLAGAGIMAAGTLGFAGRTLKGAGGVVKDTATGVAKGTAKGVAGTVGKVDEKFGITSKGASRALSRMEDKANQRMAKQSYREAKRVVRQENSDTKGVLNKFHNFRNRNVLRTKEYDKIISERKGMSTSEERIHKGSVLNKRNASSKANGEGKDE